MSAVSSAVSVAIMLTIVQSTDEGERVVAAEDGLGPGVDQGPWREDGLHEVAHAVAVEAGREIETIVGPWFKLTKWSEFIILGDQHPH